MTAISKGMLLRTKTTTLKDVFGEVVWEVVRTGLPSPDKARQGQMDGVKCVMLGGSGPSARKGYSVVDSEAKISQDIEAGITVVVDGRTKDALLERYARVRPGMSGVLEV